MSLAANGNKLHPFMVFKGKPDGHNAKRELPTYSTKDQVITCCQKKGRTDIRVMKLWNDLVLRPYVAEYGDGVTAPILLLDSYKVHVCDEIATFFVDQGVRVIIIPPIAPS